MIKEPSLGWIANEIFRLMDEKGITVAKMEKMVLETTGLKISRNSIRWWKNGNSFPRIHQTEAMARALGYEMDLILRPTE